MADEKRFCMTCEVLKHLSLAKENLKKLEESLGEPPTETEVYEEGVAVAYLSGIVDAQSFNPKTLVESMCPKHSFGLFRLTAGRLFRIAEEVRERGETPKEAGAVQPKSPADKESN